MKTRRLAGSAKLLSHHVDGLELTCSVLQLPGLLLRDRTDPLDRKLEELQHLARAQRPQCAVESDWRWLDVEPVIVHPGGMRRGSRYALECSAWLCLVAAVDAVVPRITLQLRADYLLAVGPLAAFDQVTGWAESHLLPLVLGRPDEDENRWRISRIDLAADVIGVQLDLRRFDDFTSRANVRRTYHDEPESR